MNKNDRERLNELEIFALDKYCDYNNINVRDYVNFDVMGLVKYQEYIELYKQEFGHCFECNTSPCDEGCPYQVDKGDKNE